MLPVIAKVAGVGDSAAVQTEIDWNLPGRRGGRESAELAKAFFRLVG